MVAILHETVLEKWLTWAPIGRGHELLEHWALYRRDSTRDGLKEGPDKMPWREALDKAHDSEPEWLVQVDRGIGELVRINEVYERIAKRFWLDNQAVWEVAAKVGRTTGFTALSIQATCDHIDRRVAPKVRLRA
jgi:hypothetical protein